MADLNREVAIQVLASRLGNNPALAGLPPESIQEFARRANIVLFRHGEQITRQGDQDSRFFVIIQGEIKAIDTSGTLLNYHTTGEVIGTRALLTDGVRTATLEVVIDADVAIYTQDDWYWLVAQDPGIRDYFEEQEKLFRRRAERRFSGQQPDEVVVIKLKRHPLAFIANLTWPIALLIVPILILITLQLVEINVFSAITRNQELAALAAVIFVIPAILMTLYYFLEWLNDDFIVSTKRVIHIERFLFYGEERDETPLTQIQNVTIKSHGFFDLLFDVDDIVIATAGTAPIAVDNIPSAQIISQIILAAQERSKARIAAADINSVRQQLDGLRERKIVAQPPPPEVPRIPPFYVRFWRTISSILSMLKPSYFLPRIKEEKEDIPFGEKKEKGIIWRKHYYVLLGHIFLPVLSFVITLYFFFTLFFAWPLQLMFGLVAFGSFVWYLWEYDDWRRDTYIVTDTRIVDVESSAFRLLGEEQREGSFDSIQNINYQIPNFFYKILNLGDVTIRTAGTGQPFTFKKVFSPSSVQAEIFRRWDSFQQKKREKTRDETYKQVVTVVREYDDIYHDSEQPTS